MAAHGDQIDAFLERELDTFISETARLCAKPSVSAKGEGMAACADLVADLLGRHGFHVRQIATRAIPSS